MKKLRINKTEHGVGTVFNINEIALRFKILMQSSIEKPSYKKIFSIYRNREKTIESADQICILKFLLL